MPIFEQTIPLKNKALLITAIIFFLAINTSYFWEGFLSIWLLFAMLLLLITFVFLAGALVWHAFNMVDEKFRSKDRNITVAVLTIVLALVIYKPWGIINFEKLEGKGLLIAEREGGGNCMTTISFKENGKFYAKSVCFGVKKTVGQYTIHNDTITFSNIKYSRNKEYYEYAVIKAPDSLSESAIGDLVLYDSLTDTLPLKLWIIKNELSGSIPSGELKSH